MTAVFSSDWGDYLSLISIMYIKRLHAHNKINILLADFLAFTEQAVQRKMWIVVEAKRLPISKHHVPTWEQHYWLQQWPGIQNTWTHTLFFFWSIGWMKSIPFERMGQVLSHPTLPQLIINEMCDMLKMGVINFGQQVDWFSFPKINPRFLLPI